MSHQTVSAAIVTAIIGVVVAFVARILAGPKVGGAVLLLTVAVCAAMLLVPSNPFTQVLVQRLGS